MVVRWVGAGVVAMAIIAWVTVRSTPQAPPAGANQAKLHFTLKDMNGNDVNLESFKGRPLLINFWATWCGPCKDEIPELISLADQYKGRLVILGISIDDPPEDLRKFAAENKMNYPVLEGRGHDDLLEAYEAEFAVPISWLIRPDGTISVRHQGIETQEWFDQQIRALF